MDKKFEARFTGKNNAGLRAKIRRTVVGVGSNKRGSAVRSLADTVALTAQGLYTLALVASDYESEVTS